MNGLKQIVDVTTPSKWYSKADFTIIAGYQLKCSGVQWKTNKELQHCIQVLEDIDFIEKSSDQHSLRVKLKYYNH